MPPLSINQVTALAGPVNTVLNQSYFDFQKEDASLFRNLIVQVPPISGRKQGSVMFDDFIPIFKINEFEAPPVRPVLAQETIFKVAKRALTVAMAKLDMTGQFETTLRDRAMQQARAAELFVRDDIVEIMNFGETADFVNPLDGVTFFNVAHPKGGTTYTNRFNAALSEQALIDGIAAATRTPSDAGAEFPLGVNMNWLVVTPEEDLFARQLVNSAAVTTGISLGDNPVKNVCEVISSERLTDNGDWFLVSSGRNSAGDGGAGAFPWVQSETTTSYTVEVKDGDDHNRDDFWLFRGKSFELVNMGWPYRVTKFFAP